MACCRAGSLTPLAQYARSLRTRLNDGEKLPMLFPMYTVSFDTLLEMTMIERHEARAMRHLFPPMGCQQPPGPRVMQMRVSQNASNNMMGNLKRIPVDSVKEAQHPNLTPLPTSKIMPEPLFFWYDYLSCPQERLSESSGHVEKVRNKLLDAISSIQIACVEACSLFFALVPVLEKPS